MSTFRHFRKHSKAFFAVASVLAIGLFVFGRGTGGGGPTSNQRRGTGPVATWNYGSINEGQLQTLVGQRLVTNRFLGNLFVQGGGRSQYDFSQNVPNFLVNVEDPDGLQDEIINTEVFASLATEAGMSVSDAMINHYIKEFGLGRVDSAGVRSALASAGENVRTSDAIVFTTLRKLLLSFFYRRAYDDAAAVVLPEQRWEDWRRMNEKISLEVAVLPVENFLDEAPKPTDAQLKRLYDQFRDREPDLVRNVYAQEELPVPDPGFAEPRRVRLQYLVGDIAKRTETLLASVTDAEVADYYERNKRTEFTKSADDLLEDFSGDLMPEGEETDAAEAAGDGDAAPAETGDAAGDAAESDEPAGAAAGTEPAADAAPADVPPADAPPAADAEGAETPAATPAEPAAAPAEPAAGESGTTEPAAADGDQSSTLRPSPFRLTALQAAPADGATPADAAPQDQPPAADAAEPDATDSTEAADAAAAEPEGDEPVSDQAAPATSDATDADADAQADAAAETNDPAGSNEDATLPADAAEEAPVEYVPLAEVTDQIRERLARDKAVEQLQQQVGEAAAKLQSEYNQYGRLVIEYREAKKKPPTPPKALSDLQWLADEYDLTLVPTTDPLSFSELIELPVGLAVDDQTGRARVALAAFSTLSLYEPLVAKEFEPSAGKDFSGDWYVVLKTEDTPRRVPKFDEVRDKVAAAWRRSEAAKLAEKKAQELAKEVETAAQTFEEFFKEHGFEVIPQTALFSWRTFNPALDTAARLSTVPELKNVGPEFMEAAFALKEGEVKGLLNFDHSDAYVIRLHEREYAPEDLKKIFLKDVNTSVGTRLMQQEHYYAFRRDVDLKLAREIAGFEYDEEWRKRREAELAERD